MDLGYIKAQLGAVSDAGTRKALTEIFKHVCESVDLGEPTHQTRAGNVAAYYQASTTGLSTGEFSFQHGLGVAPSFAIPVLDLRQAGAHLVPLEVARVADTKRVYLKSTSTNAAFVLLIG